MSAYLPETEPLKRTPESYLQPDTAPGDVPDFAEEFTTAGVEKGFWKSLKVEIEKNTRELLI